LHPTSGTFTQIGQVVRSYEQAKSKPEFKNPLTYSFQLMSILALTYGVKTDKIRTDDHLHHQCAIAPFWGFLTVLR
jgi:hypothetical protein